MDRKKKKRLSRWGGDSDIEKHTPSGLKISYLSAEPKAPEREKNRR
jgi:hypothetical protein